MRIFPTHSNSTASPTDFTVTQTDLTHPLLSYLANHFYIAASHPEFQTAYRSTNRSSHTQETHQGHHRPTKPTTSVQACRCYHFYWRPARQRTFGWESTSQETRARRGSFGFPLSIQKDRCTSPFLTIFLAHYLFRKDYSRLSLSGRTNGGEST